MTINTVLPACLLISVIFWPLNISAIDESVEPPIAYTVRLNGESFSTKIGEKLVARGTFKDPVIELSAVDVRHFNYGDVAFDYPSYFTWEAEIEGTSSRTWTLSGNDFKIMYFRYSVPFTPETLAKNMLSQFSGSAPKDVERTLGSHNLKGKAFSISIVSSKFTNEAYSVKVPKGSGVLVFQDSVSDVNKSSEEAKLALAIIEKSFNQP